MTVKIRPHRCGGWEVDIRGEFPDGRPYRERIKSPVTAKTASRRWGEQRELEILARGTVKPAVEIPQAPVPTLAAFEEDYFAWCVGAGNEKGTIGLKRTIWSNWLLPHLGDLPLDKITSRPVTKLVSAMAATPGHKGRERLSFKYRNNVLTTLRTVFTAAVKLELIQSPPCEVETIRGKDLGEDEIHWFEVEDLERLKEGAAKVDADTYLLIMLGSRAGLRIGEILGLEQSDVDFKRNFIHVQRQIYEGETKVTKGKSRRRVPMVPELAQALAAHRHLSGKRVLPGLTSRVAGGWMKKAERRAGLPETGLLHSLRHTYCTHLAILGTPARTIQELAGHKDLQTTLKYLHYSRGSGEAWVHRLGSYRGGPAAEQVFGDSVETDSESVVLDF